MTAADQGAILIAKREHAKRCLRHLLALYDEEKVLLSLLSESLTGVAEGHADLKNPAAMWKLGVRLSDVLDSECAVDPEKVSAIVDRVVGEYGLARK